MAVTITANICKVELEQGVIYDSTSDLIDGIDTDEEEKLITATLMTNFLPPPCEPPAVGRFTAELVPDPETVPCLSKCWYYQEVGTFEEVEYIRFIPPYYNELFTWINGLVEIFNPVHCQLCLSAILAQGPPDDGLEGKIILFTTPGVPDAIPDDPNEIAPLAGTTQAEVIKDNSIVPGMSLNAEHTFCNGSGLLKFVPDKTYYGTCCFVGGEIISVDGDYNDVDITYTVKIFGVEYSGVPPTDFVEWAVGDWVFLMGTETSCTDLSDCGGQNETNFDISVGWRIVPLKIGSYGA